VERARGVLVGADAASGAGSRRLELPSPNPAFDALRDHVGFYPAPLECFVGGERVRPQPGRFYAGWITDEVVGPFKGEPGTEGW
jgi:hypothetical protein